jgi:AAA domain
MPDSLPEATQACQAPLLTPYSDPLPHILPTGGISLLAGAPNVGKTALLACLLRDLRDGRAIFGRQPNPVPAIGFINADRSWARGAGQWFERAGYPEISQYSMADDETFSPRRLRKRHERTDILASFVDLLKLPPHSLIVVDPIALFLGGNLLNYDDCAVACHEIRGYLRAKQYTMFATAHSSKIKADKKERYMRLQDQILGSTAIFGFTDTQMYLASPTETGKPYYTFLWHPHSAPAEVFQLEQDETGLFQLYTGADSANQNRVLDLFPETDRPLTLAALVDLAEVYPLSKATVKRVLDALIDGGRIAKVAHGQYARIIVH